MRFCNMVLSLSYLTILGWDYLQYEQSECSAKHILHSISQGYPVSKCFIVLHFIGFHMNLIDLLQSLTGLYCCFYNNVNMTLSRNINVDWFLVVKQFLTLVFETSLINFKSEYIPNLLMFLNCSSSKTLFYYYAP